MFVRGGKRGQQVVVNREMEKEENSYLFGEVEEDSGHKMNLTLTFKLDCSDRLIGGWGIYREERDTYQMGL